MAEKRKPAPAEGPNGVDRWTSNGYGLIVNGEKAEPEKPKGKEDKIDVVREK